MELRHLRYFLAVGEDLHFGRAAERLHISVSALSQQIRALERELGVDLFVRSRHGVRITPAGALLYDGARPLVASIDRLADDVRGTEQAVRGVFKVGLARSKPHDPVMRAIMAALRQQPQVAVTTASDYTAATVAAVAAHEIDAGFVDLPAEDPSGKLVFEPVHREPLVAALPAGHPLAAKESVTADELRRIALVFWPRSQAPGNWLATLTGIYGPLIPGIVRFEPDEPTLLAAVAEGSGYVPLPESLQSWARPEGVAFRPFTAPAPTALLGVCWSTENSHPALAALRRQTTLLAVT